MANRAKRKGDRAELEVQALLRDLLGVPARRKLGAGRLDDIGDIDGVDGVTISVVAYGRHDFATAVRVKPLECEEQRVRAGTTFAATFVKLPRAGAGFVVVLTPEQWATYVRETL
jgi:hypothetical protein